MKKIAIVASGLLWATGVFADGVSSQEIVGYQTYKLNSGYGMTTSTFAPTGESGISLQSLIPAGAGVGGYGDVVIQRMNDSGEWSGEFAWWTKENLGGDASDGWYDTEMNRANEEIGYKEGLFAQAGEDVSLVYSGMVAQGTIETALPNGYSMTGNARPKELSIQEIIPQGTGVGGYGDIVIQTMNAEGSWDGEFAWWTKENLGGSAQDGWYDTEMNRADATIRPGEGFFVQTSADDVKLTYSSSL